MSLSKEQLLGLGAKRKRVEVQVPELGGVVLLQTPTTGDWIEYQTFVAKLDEHSFEHLTRIVSLTAIDEDGKPLLTDADCRELPYDVILRLSREARAVTRWIDEEVEKRKGESAPTP